MATRVFGPGVEPGGMDLDDNHDEVQCPACKGKAIARYWEACEGGAINAYNNIHCTVCGHFEGDTGEGDEYDQWLDDNFDNNIDELIIFSYVLVYDYLNCYDMIMNSKKDIKVNIITL